MIDQTQIPNDWREWWTERAAIMHFDGGLPLAAAEQEALACLRAYVTAYRERQRHTGASYTEQAQEKECGEARHGRAWQGAVRQSTARHGTARNPERGHR